VIYHKMDALTTSPQEASPCLSGGRHALVRPARLSRIPPPVAARMGPARPDFN
jgi:hypothetical protein